MIYASLVPAETSSYAALKKVHNYCFFPFLFKQATYLLSLYVLVERIYGCTPTDFQPSFGALLFVHLQMLQN